MIKKPFENSVGKRENAGDQHFLFIDVYTLKQITVPVFIVNIILPSANALNSDMSKF